MNPQLQKHINLYNGDYDAGDSREALGWWKDLMMWAERLYERSSQFQCILPAEKNSQTEESFVALLRFELAVAVSVAMVLFYLTNDSTCFFLGLLPIVLFAIRMENATEEGQRLAQRNRIFLQIAELLGSIGAPVIEHRIERRFSSSEQPIDLFTNDKNDANQFLRFVQAESESLQTISSAIQRIEKSTRFVYGGTMASKCPSNILPVLRHRVHSLLRAKRTNLELLRQALTIPQEESPSKCEEHLKANPAEDQVVTISLLRDMYKEAARLLSNICGLVLCTNVASRLSLQRFLLQELWLESQGASAFLNQAMNATPPPLVDSNNKHEQQVFSVQDMASSLHLALVSLHQHHQKASDGFDAKSKALVLQQWQATARQSRLLSERIDDLLASMNEMEQEVETDDHDDDDDDNCENDSSRGEAPTLESDDDTAAHIGTAFSPRVTASAAETLVYSDVTDPPKPRRRRLQQARPESSIRNQPSPFALVEELQVRLQMIAVPEERSAT